MNPIIPLAGFGLFLICLIVHILWWRFARPNGEAGVLFCVFFFPCAALILLWQTGIVNFPGTVFFAVLLLHTALSCAYIQIYPASQADSPSLKIMLLVDRAMPQGLNENEISARFHPGELFDMRIRDLLGGGFIREAEGRLTLTLRGRVFISPFIFLRRIIGLPAGGG